MRPRQGSVVDRAAQFAPLDRTRFRTAARRARVDARASPCTSVMRVTTWLSTQSAAKGDVIPAGGVRYYLSYYRDPVVQGNCTPLVDTFNASQGVSVLWAP